MPRPPRRGESRARRVGTCSTGESSRRRAPVSFAPETDCDWRAREVAAMAGPDEKVAFLGLGIMGRPMAANLARAGFEVIAWNRTREKAERLAEGEDRVSVADSPAAAAREA